MDRVAVAWESAAVGSRAARVVDLTVAAVVAVAACRLEDACRRMLDRPLAFEPAACWRHCLRADIDWHSTWARACAVRSVLHSTEWTKRADAAAAAVAAATVDLVERAVAVVAGVESSTAAKE